MDRKSIFDERFESAFIKARDVGLMTEREDPQYLSLLTALFMNLWAPSAMYLLDEYARGVERVFKWGQWDVMDATDESQHLMRRYEQKIIYNTDESRYLMRPYPQNSSNHHEKLSERETLDGSGPLPGSGKFYFKQFRSDSFQPAVGQIGFFANGFTDCLQIELLAGPELYAVLRPFIMFDKNRELFPNFSVASGAEQGGLDYEIVGGRETWSRFRDGGGSQLWARLARDSSGYHQLDGEPGYTVHIITQSTQRFF